MKFKTFVISVCSLLTLAAFTVSAESDDLISDLPDSSDAAQINAEFVDDLTGDELYQAALLYRDSDDFDTGLKFMHAAYEKGNDNALVEVAAWYLSDKMPVEDGEDNNEIGLNLLHYAASLDSGMAYYYWGLIYGGNPIPGLDYTVSEDVVPRNMDKAIACYEKSIDFGYNKAYRYLGNIYYYGENGVEVDYEKAADLYRISAEKGDTTCSHLYADCLYYGIGVEQDVDKAMEYYLWLIDDQPSNKDDYGTAAYMLGLIYEEGIYAEQDLELAQSYYELAVSLEKEGAEEALERVEAEMD